MNPENAIEVTEVTKKYKVYFDRGSSLKERVLFNHKNKYEERQVLKSISFNIKKGETVGLIGSNGCGKSTTLKLLTKIIYPDSGNIQISGRVSSLIELGAGFHPDMSGKENIYTNASIFGLKRREIDERLNSIIEFSELEEFIDNPIRTYSSGMYMRLAFSVAINVNADILLIDEILAVGDISFQKKCIEKIKEIKNAGTTIVIVSHSMAQIEEICEKTIWLEKGLIKEIGNPKEVHQRYWEKMEIKRLEKIRNLEEKTENKNAELQIFHKLTIRSGNGLINFIRVWLEDTTGLKTEIFNIGDDIMLKAQYISKMKKQNCILSFAITRNDGVLCYATNSDIETDQPVVINSEGIICIELKNCTLLSGTYALNIAITTCDGIICDDLQRVLYFKMESSKADMGICRINSRWLKSI